MMTASSPPVRRPCCVSCSNGWPRHPGEVMPERRAQPPIPSRSATTGCHVGGKLKWVHGAATDQLTLLGVDDHRGVEGIKSLGVLEEITGIVVHDAWPAYWNMGFEKVRGHGLCNAHHLRE